MRVSGLVILGVMTLTLSGCSHSKEVPKIPENNVTPHQNGYEDAWVVKVDMSTKLVDVQTVTDKTNITFKAEDELLSSLEGRVNWIVPVTFDCSKPKKKCDLNKAYILYVADRRVEPVSIRKRKK